jgi:hypothetical protein
MPSEKLRYLKFRPQRTGVYSRSWSDEQGDRLISVSRDEARVYVRVKEAGRGELEVALSLEDAADLLRALAEVGGPRA